MDTFGSRVNFQPLTRGSAACGLVALMGLFLSIGEELKEITKQDMQTDWEGITTPYCSDFLQYVFAALICLLVVCWCHGSDGDRGPWKG